MKIIEITEGWGEYSNKSNHRMNKFKRKGDLNEFTEFSSEDWSPEMASAIEDILGRNDGEALVSIKDALSELMKVDADEVKKNMKFLINLLKSYDLEDDLQEGQFGQWAKAGADAAMGATGRALARGANVIGAKMGSGKAQGAQKIDQATMGVFKNYNRYLGQANLEMDYSSLKNYLTALGIENPQMKENFAPGADPMKGQKGVTTKLTKNQVMAIIRKNLEAGVKTGSLPKEVQKFLAK